MSLPALFVSHGAPVMALQPGAAGEALRRLGLDLPRPGSILVVSAHWETPAPTLSTALQPETIHDFVGFPAPLYRLRYPAPGAPELARRAAGLLQHAGIGADLDPQRGLDHDGRLRIRRAPGFRSGPGFRRGPGGVSAAITPARARTAVPAAVATTAAH